MYIDAKLQFAAAQTLAGDAVSTNVLDMNDARNIGVGENLYIVVAAKTALTGTLQVNLEVDDADNFPSATVKDLGSFALGAAAGSVLIHRINPAEITEQYVRLDFNNATAGSVDAFVTHCIDAYTSYPNGYTITG